MSVDPETVESKSNFRTVPDEIDHMPPGIPYIVGNEAAERFSYYGMKAILTVFMTGHLLTASGEEAFMSDPEAKKWMHTFGFAVYFFPIMGAILSDWLIGKYRIIIGLSIVYCLGHATLALMDVPQLTGIEPRTFLFVGLILIAVGSGGIKPCVSAHVGDQFGQKNKHLISRIFGWFYFSINLGSTVSTFLIPEILRSYGPGWAFGIPGVLMAVATFMFWMGRHKYVHIPASGNKFFSETFSPDGLKAMGNLIPLYLFIVMFWALFDQTSSAWVLQAKSMDRELPYFVLNFSEMMKTWQLEFEMGRWTALPSQLQVMNPILVMILIPIFSYIIYPVMGKFFEVTPLRRIGIGLFVTAPAFIVNGYVQVLIENGEMPHIIWHFWAYVIITCAEVMVSITALEFSYTQAPKKMKSFVMALFLLSVSLGNLLVAEVNRYIELAQNAGNKLLDGPNYYWFFASAMLITAVLYVVWSQFYTGQTYIQGTETIKGRVVSPGEEVDPEEIIAEER